MDHVRGHDRLMAPWVTRRHHHLELPVPSGLASGIYWLSLDSSGARRALRVAILR